MGVCAGTSRVGARPAAVDPRQRSGSKDALLPCVFVPRCKTLSWQPKRQSLPPGRRLISNGCPAAPRARRDRGAPSRAGGPFPGRDRQPKVSLLRGPRSRKAFSRPKVLPGAGDRGAALSSPRSAGFSLSGSPLPCVTPRLPRSCRLNVSLPAGRGERKGPQVALSLQVSSASRVGDSVSKLTQVGATPRIHRSDHRAETIPLLPPAPRNAVPILWSCMKTQGLLITQFKVDFIFI